MVVHPLSNFPEYLKPLIGRDQSTTQTVSLIAASSRTWRGSWTFVTWCPAQAANKIQ